MGNAIKKISRDLNLKGNYHGDYNFMKGNAKL